MHKIDFYNRIYIMKRLPVRKRLSKPLPPAWRQSGRCYIRKSARKVTISCSWEKQKFFPWLNYTPLIYVFSLNLILLLITQKIFYLALNKILWITNKIRPVNGHFAGLPHYKIFSVMLSRRRGAWFKKALFVAAAKRQFNSFYTTKSE